jgi:hypothetical protein
MLPNSNPQFCSSNIRHINPGDLEADESGTLHTAYHLFPFWFFYGQVQPGAVSVLPEGTPGQLQPEAARVPRPQHEVRPVPQEGEGG